MTKALARGLHGTTAAALLCAGSAMACGACGPLVAARIAAQPFWPLVLVMAAPAAAVATAAWAVHRRGVRR